MSSIHKSLNELWTSATAEDWENSLDDYDRLIEKGKILLDNDISTRTAGGYIIILSLYSRGNIASFIKSFFYFIENFF